MTITVIAGFTIANANDATSTTLKIGDRLKVSVISTDSTPPTIVDSDLTYESDYLTYNSSANATSGNKTILYYDVTTTSGLEKTSTISFKDNDKFQQYIDGTNTSNISAKTYNIDTTLPSINEIVRASCR